jgi:hypothetical protein
MNKFYYYKKRTRVYSRKMADVELNGVKYYFPAENVAGAMTALQTLGYTGVNTLYPAANIDHGSLIPFPAQRYIIHNNFAIDMLNLTSEFIECFLQGFCGVYNVFGRQVRPVIIFEQHLMMTKLAISNFMPQPSSDVDQNRQSSDNSTLPSEYLGMVAQHASPTRRLFLNRIVAGNVVGLSKLDFMYEDLLKRNDYVGILLAAVKNDDLKMLDYVLMTYTISVGMYSIFDEITDELIDATDIDEKLYSDYKMLDKLVKIGFPMFYLLVNAVKLGYIGCVERYINTITEGPIGLARLIEIAAGKRQFDIVKLLMSMCGDDCKPILSSSTSNSTVEILEYLLAHKSYSQGDLNAALRVAENSASADVANFLRSKGAQ